MKYPELPDEDTADALDWIRLEQVYLWGDLQEARRRAIGGCISIQCEGILNRIRQTNEFVGPVHWANISFSDIQNGNYRVYCEIIGGEFSYPTDEQLEETKSLFARRGLQ